MFNICNCFVRQQIVATVWVGDNIFFFRASVREVDVKKNTIQKESKRKRDELISLSCLKNQYSLKLAAEIIKDTPFLDNIKDIHSNRLLHLALLHDAFLQEVLKDESLYSINI